MREQAALHAARRVVEDQACYAGTIWPSPFEACAPVPDAQIIIDANEAGPAEVVFADLARNLDTAWSVIGGAALPAGR